MDHASEVTRRELLKRVLFAAGAGIVAGSGLTKARPQFAAAKPPVTRHLAWAWQFNEDGDPGEIRDVLSQNRLGIILKTHEGSSWMSRWDDSPHAIGGPAHVSKLASFFEAKGVPFHAWAVVEGEDPLREAQMCSDVLNSGARTITLDLEPQEGKNYWMAGPDEAVSFGKELRRLQPTAHITIAPDPRPWQLKEVPMAEFAAFSDEIAPQLYWRTFDSQANYDLMDEYGVRVSPDGLSPEDVLDMSQNALSTYGLPIRPVGQGAAELPAWDRFVRHAYSLGMQGVSVWRYGTADQSLWPFLRAVQTPSEAPAPIALRTHFGWAR